MSMIAEVEAALKAPFGTVFGDKMVVTRYRDGAWQPFELCPYGPLSLDPATHALHYGSTCFEGIKAHRWENGSLHVFRLRDHVERMRQSAKLLCLPVPEADLLFQMVMTAVDACRDWAPPSPGALYIRPTLIGTLRSIGAAAGRSPEACLYVILSPVGDYFRGGLRPLKLLIEESIMRTAPDFGMAKTGGNYASALRVILKARTELGVDQVLFCPNGDVQETGAANFVLINNHEILTKSLDPSFLHGITRNSILTLAKTLGYHVAERDFTIGELLEWCRHGEAALSGTAAVLAGVGGLYYRDAYYDVGDGGFGPNTKRLRDALLDIQKGRADDPHHWLSQV